MQNYNAKDKFIMKGDRADILGHSHRDEYLGGASRRVRRVRRSRRRGGKRPFRKRTCRSKSRCGGGDSDMHTQMFSPGAWYRVPDGLSRLRLS